MADQQPQTETETPGPGHNSGDAGEAARERKSGIAAERLRAFVERIERLEEEKADLAKDIREVYAEAKGTGFDAKTLRQVVRLRKLDKAERQEQEALLDLYKHALGMLDGTPLGDAAMKSVSAARPLHTGGPR